MVSGLAPTSSRGNHSVGASQAQPRASAATTYRRRESHKPRTSTTAEKEEEEEEHYYVLTLATDAAHHDAMSALRKRYFPPTLLKVPAHISLFRALPGSQLPTITSDIRSVMLMAAASSQGDEEEEGHKAFPICAQTQTPFRMARGVGVGIAGLRPAERWFEELQARWRGFLSRQDRARFRGHYTVMNKVDDEQAILRCLEELGRGGVKGSEGMVCGMTLWRYDRGWWHHHETFTFPKNAHSE
ncbi:hypothetical protein SLS62_001203 [Diatrype stigma]|uniref:Uncharacterized protein n=1 Tax=Diatrype stigma TaxID=117547 RepID=A0AAN9V285_9PEZI